ncbi:MAG: hypothetical protein CSA09_05150 [Candidatus Contendobacter odensis]|uniref:Fimbrial assembly protein n=1 Tax=Candidatus Contendibacter odensensis TaxID=1400860 RepID=A0A2G6PF44_9GAMM|nr:MAG: hypothetical protein CSA09_05150 [Candidatus Contendobacter odensis]
MTSSYLQILKSGPRVDLSGFLRWWRDGLLAWLPKRIRGLLSHSERWLVFEICDGSIRLSRQQNGEIEALRDQPLADLDRETVSRLLRTEKPTELVLRLPAASALLRRVMLPLAAAANLRQVLAFEMDRLTPFDASKLYYDALVLERQPELRRMWVELTVLPRGEVNAALESLAAISIVPDRIDIQGSQKSINVLPPEKRPRRGVFSRRLLRVLIVIGLGMVVANALVPLWQQRSLAITLQQQVNALQRQSGEVLALRERMDKAVEISRFLLRKKQNNPPMINLLRELTIALPDSVWLERLQFKDNTVQLIGQAVSASILVGLIENTKLFENASFTSPVTNDRRTGKERFVLSANIVSES